LAIIKIAVCLEETKDQTTAAVCVAESEIKRIKSGDGNGGGSEWLAYFYIFPLFSIFALAFVFVSL